MKIALDVDGVLADVIEPWLAYNNTVRKPLEKADVTDWDFWRRLGIDRLLFYEELSLCWKDWASIPPTERDLARATEDLSALGQVDILTAREKSTDHFVKEWLKLHGISYGSYVSVDYGPKKAEFDYDVFIDDSPLNASRFMQGGKAVLLYCQPWNRGVSGPGMRRISSLHDAVKLLKP